MVIIEHPDVSVLLEREMYWINKLKPAYNMVYKYTASKVTFKDGQVIDSELLRNRTQSARTKESISQSMMGEKYHFYNKQDSEASIEQIRESRSSGQVFIYDIF